MLPSADRFIFVFNPSSTQCLATSLRNVSPLPAGSIVEFASGERKGAVCFVDDDKDAVSIDVKSVCYRLRYQDGSIVLVPAEHLKARSRLWDLWYSLSQNFRMPRNLEWNSE